LFFIIPVVGVYCFLDSEALVVATAKSGQKFSVGAKVVYPSHGIGTIARIDGKDVSGFAEPCYVISFKSGMTIMAPLTSSATVGLRRVISRRQVTKVMTILKDSGADAIESNWNKRQKTYQEKIKSGSIFEVALVLRDLYSLRTSKGLSFGEQQVFDNARKLIVSELAVAKGAPEATIIEMIDDALTN